MCDGELLQYTTFLEYYGCSLDGRNVGKSGSLEVLVLRYQRQDISWCLIFYRKRGIFQLPWRFIYLEHTCVLKP